MLKPIPEPDRALAILARALGHEGRTFMIRLLVRNGELTVGELVERTGMRQSEVSRHLKTLRQASLVEVEAQGRTRVYRANRAMLRRASGLLGSLAMYAG